MATAQQRAAQRRSDQQQRTQAKTMDVETKETPDKPEDENETPVETKLPDGGAFLTSDTIIRTSPLLPSDSDLTVDADRYAPADPFRGDSTDDLELRAKDPQRSYHAPEDSNPGTMNLNHQGINANYEGYAPWPTEEERFADGYSYDNEGTRVLNPGAKVSFKGHKLPSGLFVSDENVVRKVYPPGCRTPTFVQVLTRNQVITEHTVMTESMTAE